MTFRDDRDAQKHRIDSLEDELEDARAEAEKLRLERDAALLGPVLAGEKQFARGAQVWVEWNGKWWRGTVKKAIAASLWEIHYDGWSNKWDEAVGPERIAPGEQPAPGPAAGAPAPIVAVMTGLFVVLIILVVAYSFLDAYF